MEKLVEKMNLFLSNQIVLNMKIHNIHWYLEGSSFYTLHVKMDEFYAEGEERVDAVAERLLSIDAKPVASLKEVMTISEITELTDAFKDGEAGIEALLPDFSMMNELAKSLIILAEEVSDAATADYFTTVTEALQKEMWMMKAYLK